MNHEFDFRVHIVLSSLRTVLGITSTTITTDDTKLLDKYRYQIHMNYSPLPLICH